MLNRQSQIHAIQSKEKVCVCMLSCFSHVWLFATLWTVACQVPLSMEFSRQEYWRGLSCPPPGDLPDPRIGTEFLCLLHWQAGSLPLAPPEKPPKEHTTIKIFWGVYMCVCVCVCIFMTTGWFRPVQEVGNIVGFENNVKIYSANSL